MQSKQYPPGSGQKQDTTMHVQHLDYLRTSQAKKRGHKCVLCSTEVEACVGQRWCYCQVLYHASGLLHAVFPNEQKDHQGKQKYKRSVLLRRTPQGARLGCRLSHLCSRSGDAIFAPTRRFQMCLWCWMSCPACPPTVGGKGGGYKKNSKPWKTEGKMQEDTGKRPTTRHIWLLWFKSILDIPRP